MLLLNLGICHDSNERIYGGEWLASNSSHFNLGQRVYSCTYHVGVCVGTRTSLDILEYNVIPLLI
jgi:hypothetical protein